MKNRKNSPISFGITLTSGKRTEAASTDPQKRVLTVRRGNVLPVKTEQAATHEFDFPCMKLPPPKDKPFTPDMFNCKPGPLPAFPPQGKMSPEEERVQKELKRFRSRTASIPASGKTSSMAVSVPWDFFKIIFVGVFVALKYAFIAVAVVITVGCMLCAGRQTSGLR